MLIQYMFFDINGNSIPLDSILYGNLPNEEESHYWRFGIGFDGTHQLLSCTYGYVHNVSNGILSQMKYIGSLSEFSHLLECD